MVRTRTLSAAAILSVLAGAAAAHADPQVILPVNLTNGMGAVNSISFFPVDAAPTVDWTVLMQNATTNVTTMFGSLDLSLTSGAFGLTPLDFQAAGSAPGASPQTLWTRNYSFTPVGNITPAFAFTLTYDLTAPRNSMLTMNVTTLGSGLINGLPTTFNSIHVDGIATAEAVPAPGAAALLGAGGLVAIRRRRRN